jgi:hypothetical protein
MNQILAHSQQQYGDMYDDSVPENDHQDERKESLSESAFITGFPSLNSQKIKLQIEKKLEKMKVRTKFEC